MSTVEHGTGHDKLPRPECTCRACFRYTMFFLIIIFGIITFCMFLGAHPNPSFTVNDVTLYAFNLSTATSTLTSNLQIIISSQNDDSGFHFDQLDIYVSYRNQQITSSTRIPPMYLGPLDDVVWSPYVNGTEVPLTVSLAESLASDKTGMLINVKVTGRMRSKYGYIAGRYRLKVNCRAYIMFQNNNGSHVIGSAVKNPFANDGCDTNVV